MQFPFLKKSEKQKNFFLSLLIKPDKVGAILFEEINSKLFILSTNEIEVSDTSSLTAEELLNAGDKVISFVESKLPEGAEVEKTIFSVPYYWVIDGKIRQEYLDKLKKVCKDLGLVPIGYIVSIEAIVASLQKSEGAPVSGIFVEITRDRILSYVVRGGKIIEEQKGEIEGSIIKTAENLISQIQSVDVLPSKIIILDNKEASSIQQSFLSHQWPKDIPFLHLPQVMMLEKGFENEAIINGVATQMELEVLHDVPAGKIQEEAETSESKLEQVGAQDFGFVKEGEENKKVSEVSKVSKVSEVPEANLETVGEDKNGEEGEPNISYFKEETSEGFQETELEQKVEPSPSKLKIPDLSMILPKLSKLKIPNFKSVPFLQNMSGPLKIKVIIGLIGAVLFAIIVSFIYYNFILRANITIMADKKSIDKTQKVTFSKGATEGNNINIETFEETIEGEEKKNSTGIKETGDKAKGEVTVYNKTDQKKTFAKGTIVIGPNDLDFELTEEISIASTSPFSTSLSSAKGKVAASSFGKEYNLPSNTNFTVKGFSSAQFIAKNSDSITGGTKKETTVVSSKDLDELLSEVTEKLEKDAVSKGREKLSSGEDFIPKALSSEVLEKKYTKKENEEAGSVGISAKVKYSLGKYKKGDVDHVVESLSRSDIPGTYVLRTSESKIEVTDVKIGKDNNASATLKVNAVYTPKVESEKLAESLKGKGKSFAENQIKKITGVTDVIITFTRKLPFMPLILPQSSKNILIEEEY